MTIVRLYSRPVPLASIAVFAVSASVFALVGARPAVGGGAVAAARSLPTIPPVDAKAAGLTVLTKTVAPHPTRSKGFDGFQTVTITAPAGKTVLQGFATLSGGQTGSVLIQSTRTIAGRRFVVELIFPGSQGKPGRLYVQVQLMPRQ